jgi:predicted N-acetyltransferase YhbS
MTSAAAIRRVIGAGRRMRGEFRGRARSSRLRVIDESAFSAEPCSAMNLVIRPLQEADVPAAERIFHEAFSKFLGIPDPRDFAGDRIFLATRWRADPAAQHGGFLDGTLVGSCCITRWGSFGFIGPVSVRPDLWDKGVAKQLVANAVAFLEDAGIRQAALFTFAGSPKHIALYQKFGFWPQYLTPVMAKSVRVIRSTDRVPAFSKLSPAERNDCLAQCAGITDGIFPGLSLEREIRSIADQGLGETVLCHDERGLAGFACCHVGAGSEARRSSSSPRSGWAKAPPKPSRICLIVARGWRQKPDAKRSWPASTRHATRPIGTCSTAAFAC